MTYLDTYIKALAGLFFPASCPGCGQAQPVPHHICTDCTEGLPICPNQALTALPIKKPFFTRAFTPYYYRDPIKKMILKFKYSEEEGLHHLLGRHLASFAARVLPLKNYAAITYVPLPRGRKIRRGFNQAERLARHVAHRAGYEMPQTFLKRLGRRPLQERSTRTERLKNPMGSFSLSSPLSVLSGQDILLVDDVLTTGATVNECARVLCRAGARRVDVLALARSTKRGQA